jgi:hypothetical protein
MSHLSVLALKGSDHLDFLVDHRLFRPTSTRQIEDLYDNAAPKPLNQYTFVTPSDILRGINTKESLLLEPGVHSLVARSLQVPQLAVEIERAVHQVKESLEFEASLNRQKEETSNETEAEEEEEKLEPKK